MNCSTARAILARPGNLRIVDEETANAHEHAGACEACRTYLAQGDEVVGTYAREGVAPVPRELQERIVRAVERRRRGELVGRTVRAAAWPAAILVFVAAMVWLQLDESRSANPPDIYVEDYMRRAVGQDHIETTDPAEVTSFLQRELGLRLEPLAAQALTLQRAEICLLEGRRGAMIVYKHDGAIVSHYLLPRDEVRPRLPEISPREGSPQDMPVVTWAADQVEQALVGEVDPELLLALASGR